MSADVLESLGRIRILPVVVLDDAARAPDLAAALVRGGIPCAEITLRTPAALEAIAAAAADPGILVGAGTVLTTEQVDRVADAGARFVVSPGFDADVVERALTRGLEVLPGVATATEMQRAIRAGLRRVKFFPAGVLGGPEAIAAFAQPFPDLLFVPSGGVTLENAPHYLDSPAVLAVSGSWMAPRDAIARGDFAAIEEAARRTAALTASRP